MSKKPSKKKSIKKDNNKEIEAIRKLRDLDEKLNRTSIENALLPNPSEGEESATDALESNLLGDKFLEKKDEPTDSINGTFSSINSPLPNFLSTFLF